MPVYILCALVFLAAFVDSIAGGGGLISLPAYYAAAPTAHLALGCNKFSSSFAATVSTIEYAKKGKIDLRIALTGSVFAIIGAYLGASLVLLINENAVRVVLLVMIPLIALFTFLKRDFGTAGKQRFTGMWLYIACAVTSLVLGIYDGFFGPGTGTFYIIVFTAFFGMDAVSAGGNAKAINLASNLGALCTFIFKGSVDYSIALPTTAFAMLGGFVGSRLAIKGGVRVIKPVMLVVMALLLIRVACDLFM